MTNSMSGAATRLPPSGPSRQGSAPGPSLAVDRHSDSEPPISLNEVVRSKRVVWVALVAGGLAIAGLLLAAWFAASASRRAVVEQVGESHFSLAQILTDRIESVAAAAAEPDEDAAESALHELTELWSELAARLSGRDLWVIGSSSHLVYHSTRPDLVGKYVGDVVVPDSRFGTVRELIAARQGWGGENLNLRGLDQITAYSYSPTLDGLIAIHLPGHLLSERIRAQSTPWILALGIIALVLVPFAMMLLLFASRRSNRAVVAAARREREVQAKIVAGYQLQSLGRLTSGIAHDFNNLLTVILAYSGPGLNVTRSPAATRAALAEISNAGKMAAGLTRQLLGLARESDPRNEVCDAADVLRDMSGLFRRVLPESIELTVESPSNGDVVITDRVQFEQVLMNLAVNARDAMPEGGRLKIRFAVEGQVDPAAQAGLTGRTLVVEVSDTGMGIPDDVRERMFEIFYTTKGDGGAGLGLSLVRDIVQKMGGDIAVQSEVGVGTTFRVAVPESRSAIAPDVGDIGPLRRPVSGRILVVEDESKVRAVMVRALRIAGYDIVWASNGVEALARIRATTDSIDLVITDVIMPQMGGLELASHLREELPGVPIVFTSACLGDQESSRESAEFLSKPFSPSDLLAVAQRLIDGAK